MKKINQHLKAIIQVIILFALLGLSYWLLSQC